MRTYVAFLRAINLGAVRKFPKDALLACAEQAGFSEPATYLNTGNLRVGSRLRSRARVESVLEEAFATDRGFDVPTIAYTTDEVVALADDAARLGTGHTGYHAVALLKEPPTQPGVEALREEAGPGERVEASDRAVHLLVGAEFHRTRLTTARVEKHLGITTMRRDTVLQEIVTRWC